MKKKTVYYCDPREKVEVQVIYWNERSEDTFEKVPYLVHGVRVQEYNGNFVSIQQAVLTTLVKTTILGH